MKIILEYKYYLLFLIPAVFLVTQGIYKAPSGSLPPEKIERLMELRAKERAGEVERLEKLQARFSSLDMVQSEIARRKSELKIEYFLDKKGKGE